VRIAITGGTGFVGGHLAKALLADGHQVVVLARGVDDRPWVRQILSLPAATFVRVGVDDELGLLHAFTDCEAVAHCAGINREIGAQTYDAVHIQGTANVLRAAERAGVARIAFVSYLRARPDSGSSYFESKWQAEELVRSTSLDWTVVKPGMVFGLGDQMIDHLSRSMYTFPVFVGVGRKQVRPLAVKDLVDVLMAELVHGLLTGKTVGIVGPTEIEFDDAARLVASVIGKRRLFLRSPVGIQFAMAWMAERLMKVPLVSIAQVRMLQEGIVKPVGDLDSLPGNLTQSTRFDESEVRAALPSAGPFRLEDLRLFSARRTRLKS
jgi:uncharacterized protein YbjT (DUF2867 family)